MNDLLATIKGKTLVLAVQYSVDGQEIWNNNDGQNYLATFSKVKRDPPSALCGWTRVAPWVVIYDGRVGGRS